MALPSLSPAISYHSPVVSLRGATKTNFRVRNWRISHLKLQNNFGFPVVVLFCDKRSRCRFNNGGFFDEQQATKCLTAGALVVTLAIAAPALAFHGGGGGFGGGMHGGGFGGGMHGAGFGGGMHAMGGGGKH